jgi:hypothetical protein
MADRASLETLGFIFGGVTALVILIAAFVVRSHVTTIPRSDQSAPMAVIQPSAPVLPASLSPQR